MFWEKEMLKGLVELKGEVKGFQRVLVTYDLMVQRQQKIIEKLLDRLQAGSFQELKTYAEPEVAFERERTEFYSPFSDEDLAGEVVEVLSERTDTER